MNGFEVLKRLRATSRMPVLLLTARGRMWIEFWDWNLGRMIICQSPLIRGSWWQGFVRSYGGRRGWAMRSSLCCKPGELSWTRRRERCGRRCAGGVDTVEFGC